MEVKIEKMRATDWSSVKKIYQQGIDTNFATFELHAPEWPQWNKNHLKKCRLIAKNRTNLLGWAALSPVSSRCIYDGVAEVSIYVAEDWRGIGIGKKLLQALINESEEAGIWTLQAGIFPENKTSIRLHENNGFRRIGYREKIGKKKGLWRDVILFERRSKKIGL